MPCPCQLTVDLLTLKVVCDVGYLCANFSFPRPLCSRHRPDVRDRQTDFKHVSSLNVPYPRGGGIINGSLMFSQNLVRVTCDVGYPCANFSFPRPLCSRLRLDVRDRQTSDAHHRLLPRFFDVFSKSCQIQLRRLANTPTRYFITISYEESRS